MKKAKASKEKYASKKLISNKTKSTKIKKTVKTSKNKVLPTMSVFEVVSRFPKTAEIFMKYGLHCFGCSVARYENIEQAARVHGIPFDKFFGELNRAVK